MMRRFAAKYVLLPGNAGLAHNAFVEVDDKGQVCGYGEASASDAILDGMLVPGFVNAHCHLELSYLQGKFRKGTGMAGFIDQINAMRDTSPKEEKLRTISYWLDALWKSGVSAMADISNCADSFAIKAASPLYTRTFLEVFGSEPEDCEPVMASVRKLKEEADAAGIDAAPTPHACYTMSPQLLRAVSAEGLKYGFLSYHSEETQEEEDMMMSGTGAMADNRRKAGMSMPPVTGTSSLEYFIDSLSQVVETPFEGNILLVHEVCMTQSGVELVKKTMKHPFIALCPCSNIFIHNQLPPVSMLAESGLKLTLGTDSLSSNDTLDMVREMFCLQENFPDVPLTEILKWATLNGAEFLGKESVLGSFETGKTPGVVLIDHVSGVGRLTSASRSHRLV